MNFTKTTEQIKANEQITASLIIAGQNEWDRLQATYSAQAQRTDEEWASWEANNATAVMLGGSMSGEERREYARTEQDKITQLGRDEFAREYAAKQLPNYRR